VRESWVRYLAWVLVVVFPASVVMADATSAMLVASGDVSVNGSRIERATAVFPGDKVQTGPNALATLTSQGSSVTVAANSSLVFSRSFVNVLCGSALIATSRGMSVRVSNLLVQPARGAQARFQINQHEGQLQIIAREGTLAIDNGAATTSLQPGRMLTASATCMAAPYGDDQTSSSPSAAGNSQEGSSRKKAAAAVPPAAGGTNASTLWLIGAGAVGLGLILTLATTSGGSSSPPPASNVVPGVAPAASR